MGIAFYFQFLCVLISCVWPVLPMSSYVSETTPVLLHVYVGALYVCGPLPPLFPPKGEGLELLPLTFCLGLTFILVVFICIFDSGA